MRRRQFLAGFGGVAGLPLAAWAQQGRTRRVSVLMAFDEYDSEGKTYLSEFTQGLAKLGWIDGSNLRVDVRWGAGNVDRMRLSAKELLDPRPDVILAHGTPVTAAFQRETRTIPIVFASVSDPVGEGFVASLPRPVGQLAQAGGRGGGPNLGVSTSSPGHIMQSTTPDPAKGASTLAPGSTVKNEPTPRAGGASDIAPGATNPNSKRK